MYRYMYSYTHTDSSLYLSTYISHVFGVSYALTLWQLIIQKRQPETKNNSVLVVATISRIDEL